MRRAAWAVVAALLASCAGVPPPDTATLVTDGDVRIHLVDGVSVCPLGGLVSGESACPSSVEVAPGHHTVVVTRYLNRMQGEGTVEVDAAPFAVYLVKSKVVGYRATFSIERQEAPPR